MAFIVPVVRKDYILYPSIAHNNQQKPQSRSRDPRLTKSLPLIPASSKLTTNNSTSIIRSSKNPRRNSARIEANKIICHPTIPSIQTSSTILAGSNLSLPPDVDCGTDKNYTPVDSNSPQTSAIKAMDSELHEIPVVTDSGYSSSATPSPSSGSPTTSLTTTTSQLQTSITTNSMQPRLRSERILILRLRDDDKASGVKDDFPEVFQYADASSPSVRHVHFGFCEQIEYERDETANIPSTSSSKISSSEASKFGKLKRLEQKLAAQIRGTRCAAFFRPRAQSHPIASSNVQENTDINANRAEHRLYETCHKTTNLINNFAQLNIQRV